jgi:hypothetical protein
VRHRTRPIPKGLGIRLGSLTSHTARSRRHPALPGACACWHIIPAPPLAISERETTSQGHTQPPPPPPGTDRLGSPGAHRSTICTAQSRRPTPFPINHAHSHALCACWTITPATLGPWHRRHCTWDHALTHSSEHTEQPSAEPFSSASLSSLPSRSGLVSRLARLPWRCLRCLPRGTSPGCAWW